MDNASYYDALEIKEELENLGYLKRKRKLIRSVKIKNLLLRHIILKMVLKYVLGRITFKMII